MTTIHRRGRLLAAVGTLALATAACGGVGDAIAERAAEEVAEQAAGGDVEFDVDEDGGRMRIESSEGTLDIGGTELPDGFPDGLPLPDGHEVLGSMTQGSDAGGSMFVTVGAPGAYEDVVADVESGLADGGWSVTNTSNMSSGDFASTSFTVERDDWSGNVGVTRTEEGVQLTYTLEQAAG